LMRQLAFLVCSLIFLASMAAGSMGSGALSRPIAPEAHSSGLGYVPDTAQQLPYAPGISYITASSNPQNYLGALGSVEVGSLSVTQDVYYNGTETSSKGVSFQLGATIYSPAAGSFWSVVALVLNQTRDGSFTFGLIDQLWNETYTCSGPSTLDKMTDVSGNGSVVVSFPGCFGTHYQYTTPVLGVVEPPFNLTLGEYLAAAHGSFAVLYNYTMRTQTQVFGGIVDLAVVDPGQEPSSATMRVGGLTQLGFSYGMQLTVSAPNPLEAANLSSASGTLALSAITRRGTAVIPNQTYNYGLLDLSAAYGVSVYTDFSDPNRPFAVFSQGVFHPASLWPAATKIEYSASQTQPGSAIELLFNLTYYNPQTAQYSPLPNSAVELVVNGSVEQAECIGGLVHFSFKPATYGYYVVGLAYPSSLSFGHPNISAQLGVASLTTNLSGGEANFAESYPNGSTINFTLSAGATTLMLIPPSGLSLRVSTSYDYFGSGSRFGFLAWLVGGEKIGGPSIELSKPAELAALFGTQYLVNIYVPTQPPQSSWVSPGSVIDLVAPKYIYVEANLERLAFVNWSIGAAGNTSLIVDSPMNITANYVVQYKVYLSTPNSTLVDAYYPNGSTVTVKVPATLGGSFLYPNTFEGWSGTVQSHSRTLKLTVTRPIVDEAIYTVSYARVSDLETLAAVAVGVFVAVLAQKKKL